MAHNNDLMSSSHEGIQGNTSEAIPIYSYYSKMQNFLNSTFDEISKLQQSHGVLEAGVISMQQDTNKPNERQGEPSFVITTFT